jgi:lipoic acid synthetase
MADGKPEWLKVRAPTGEGFDRLRSTARLNGLRMVCDLSHCPNIGDCWSRGHATFMVLGDVCTRNCAFCAVMTGRPLPVDDDEPRRIASAVRTLGLHHVIITSVTRDDLPDQGAGHFAQVVTKIREQSPRSRVELLIPDMGGSSSALRTILSSKPDVLGHNIETVERLQGVRDRRASYEISLRTLRTIKDLDPSLLTKSSLMLGLGERVDEVLRTLEDLRTVGVDAVAIGQYLRPRNGQLEVREYVEPAVFRALGESAKRIGFRFVSSAPLVRSSLNAHRIFDEGENHADR